MSVVKYLQHYTEEETSIADAISSHWQKVLCIPAFDEADTLPVLLKRLSTEQDLLIILLLNSPQSADVSALSRTRQSGEQIKQKYSLQQSLSSDCQLLQLNQNNSHILLLERYAVPDKQGVGLARKIVCDIACKLIQDDKILSPWIHNTDADVTLPDDYFSVSAMLTDENIAAALFAFKHKNNAQPELQRALELYEYSLYYYVEALKWAESNYAFHTVGSTLLLHYRHYALARGFPKRAAGEDFYLLNKLRKTGRILELDSPLLTLSGRSSARVPFGTGPAVNKISALQNPDEEYLFYHPQCFVHLKNWINTIPELWESKKLSKPIKDKLLLNSLITIGADQALVHALENSKNQESFIKHMNNWFDAFRTLKLIHELRDTSLHSINMMHLQSYKEDFPFIKSPVKVMP
jgi:hypothetical protein